MKTLIFCAAIFLATHFSAAATVVSLSSVRDTSIFAGVGVNNANGGGGSFIVGTNNTPEARRGLIFFDLSSIPANAVIESVSLRLTLARAPIGETDRFITLHRALASWGENPLSNAGTGGGSGSGVLAETGDATWLSRFYNQGPAWTTAGGEFTATASASTNVTTGLGDFIWSGAGMLNDVQSWVTTPTNNFGWFVLGDETASRTNRQFYTHESTEPNTIPTLTITYSVPEPHSTLFLIIGGTFLVLLIPLFRRRSRT